MKMQLCPVLYPTEQQFSNFYNYVHFLDKTYKKDYGMVKVIPPASWRPKSIDYEKRLQKLIIKNPIEQNVQGISGFLQSKNFVLKNMTFNAYRKYSLKQSKTVADNTPEQKQKLFWKTITYSSPIYAADGFNTFMDETAGPWNFNNLDSVLKYAFKQLVEGINKPYSYVGTWKAFFSWHKEDLDLSAINYIHEGEPKIWYSIANEDGHILENAAKYHFRDQYANCKQFLRHKIFLINPQVLLKNNKNIKNAGQIMLGFGGAYHCGFNCGFNIAEAVNYATVDWLRQIIDYEPCCCSCKNIKAQKSQILNHLQQSPIYSQLAQRKEFKSLKKAVQLQNQAPNIEKLTKKKETNGPKKSEENKTSIQGEDENFKNKISTIPKIKPISKCQKRRSKRNKRNRVKWLF